MKKVYLSPSNQEHNAGVGKYTTEEKRMHALAKMVAPLLKARGFQTRKSVETWEMAQVVADSNRWGADIHVCIHTNAGGGDGTVAFYGSERGKKLTSAIYKQVAPLSPARTRASVRGVGSTRLRTPTLQSPTSSCSSTTTTLRSPSTCGRPWPSPRPSPRASATTSTCRGIPSPSPSLSRTRSSRSRCL